VTHAQRSTLAPPARKRIRAASNGAPAVGAGFRILAVTRESALRDLIGRLLADVPCEIVSDLGPREALAEATDADIAVVDDAIGDHTGLKLEPDLRVLVVLPPEGKPGAERWAVDLGDRPPRRKAALADLLLPALKLTPPRRNAHASGRHRYALAIEAGNDGLWDWDLLTNSMSLSPRWRRMLGLEAEPVGNSPDEWFGRVHQDDVARLQFEIARLLHGQTESVEFECRMRHQDGTARFMLVRALAVRDGTGRVYRMAGSQTDVTSQHAAVSLLLHGTLHDSLTQLPNRGLFHDRLRHAFERAARGGSSRFAVLFVDLDRFKGVNDSLGHQAGDELLTSVASRLRECVRVSDTLARLGGDEFAVLVEEVRDAAQVVALAQRMLDALSTPFRVSGQEISATASIGIALDDGEYEAPGDVLRDADTAMYRAKSLGRARYEVFRSAMRTQGVKVRRCEA
jgi:diguanylate cyclase (GGDEF)-like protein/PAS domain S-box-containing protein